ncbi:MAG: hypothetical protein E6R00_04660 [Gammaproteobacteria bacterium]|nr:MAG: hypothetical protein E6R00_04660 [Gammaproteobacteria bacterium]
MKIVAVWLQYRGLSLTHASCTKIVHWLALLHAWLQGVGKRTRWERMKFVTLHLTFPIFNLSQLFFKVGYLCGERRLFLQTGKRNSGGLHELCTDLGDCGDKLVVIGKAVRRLRNIEGGLGAGDSSRNFSVHSETPNV